MITFTRILGLICAWAACDKIFSPPKVPINRPLHGPPKIDTRYGKVMGYFMNSINGKLIGAYEGIPYAESPTGHLRFEDPLRKRPWKNTFVADKRITCIQSDPSRYYRVIGQEDCLVLNIYTPLMRGIKVKNIPVIVWIHGGSYIWGSGSLFGPSYLLDQNIILVTINYRLGPLGFLKSADGSLRGNFGLKDQALALQWVVENIKYFGGNPRQITLAGHSAGAASVHLHMMSPFSKGKFQRAISLSGSALSFWGVPKNQTLLADRLARSVGCFSSLRESLANCLRRRSARSLVSKQYDLYKLLENPSVLFGPTVDGNGPSGFLPDEPLELYRRGEVADIPWMTGIVRDEGDLYTLVNYGAPLAIRTLVRNLTKSIPIMLDYNEGFKQRTAAIKSYYFGKFPSFSFSGFEALKSISKMVGDHYFYVPFHRTLRIHSARNTSPLYAYYFTFDGKHSVAEKLNLSPEDWGVMHMDDLQYIFNCTEFYPALKHSDRDFRISQYLTNLWTNFATTGSVGPVLNDVYKVEDYSWQPYTQQNPKLLEINFNPQMVAEPNRHRLEFWKKVEQLF